MIVFIKGLSGALETDTVLPSVLTSISPFLVVSDVLISIATGVSVPFCVVSAYVLKAIRANAGIMIFSWIILKFRQKKLTIGIVSL